MHIDLGGLFSLFKRKKKNDEEQIVGAEWQKIASDDVLNCCEQCGVFEQLKISDEEIMNKVCCDVANLFNAGALSEATLRNAFVQGFSSNSLDASACADAFVDCYMESYIYNRD